MTRITYHVSHTKKNKHLLRVPCYVLRDKKGFTLIEAVVATAVFAFVISSIVGVYLSVFQLDRKTRAERATAQNARYIMEFIGKEVRSGSISYLSYSGELITDNSYLYLENQANEVEQFALSNQNIVFTKNGNVTNLNSGGVKVTKLIFFASPAGDPYTSAKNYNEQPHITVVMELTSNYGTNVLNTVKQNLEGTFTTQTYPSRQ